MGRLQGKVAVITGGAAGIGFAIARRFVDEGAFVLITGRRQKELDEVVKALSDNVIGVQGDVSKLPDLDSLYGTVKAKGRSTYSSPMPASANSLPWQTSRRNRTALRSQRERDVVHGAKSLDADERRRVDHCHRLRRER